MDWADVGDGWVAVDSRSDLTNRNALGVGLRAEYGAAPAAEGDGGCSLPIDVRRGVNADCVRSTTDLHYRTVTTG
jgi:hypothetical protein